jgi:aerobic carbon-monoxide dehydrogenase small subunit
MGAEQQQTLVLTVNGRARIFRVGDGRGDVAPSETLVRTLREKLDLTAAKIACDKGACGACTVIVDGEALPSCSLLTVECDGKSILTLEGLEDPETGALDPLQQAFLDRTAFQCGYCSPGVVMVVKALLDKNPRPTEAQLQEALSGNYCRCGTHHQVIETVMAFTGQEVS